MQKIKFLIAPLLLITAMTTACQVEAENYGEQMKKASLTEQFVSSSSERERVSLAVTIIEESNLQRYSKLAEFDTAFGTSYNKERAKLGRGETAVAVLHLRQQAMSSAENLAADYTGWYLLIRYDGAGTVLDYYLSNAHK